MSRKLSAADIFDTLEVDLWGNAYTFRQVTKSIGAKLAASQKKVEAAMEGADQGKQAHSLIDMIDLLLEPAKDTKPAGEVLGGLYDKDELGLDWISAFAQSLAEESQARRRPTSPSQNSA